MKSKSPGSGALLVLVAAMPLLTILLSTQSAHAQAIWNQVGDPILLPWEDNANWDTGLFPDGAGVVANFTDPTGFIDTNAIIELGQNITIGQLNFQDFVDNGTDNIGQSDLQLRSGAGIILTLDRGDDTIPAINFIGSYNDFDFIRLSQNDNLIIAGDDGLAINTGGMVILDGPNTYTGQTIVTGLDTGPDRSGDGRLRVEDVNGLGAAGPGNETIIVGSGAPDGFGSQNRLETSLRFGGNEALGGPVVEDIIFRWNPVPNTDTTGTRRQWDDTLFVEDDHPVSLTGTITLQRLPEVDPQEGDTRWEFQVGDTGTGNGDANIEFLEFSRVVFDDQSGAVSNGDFENHLSLNAVNGPTDPEDPTTGSMIVVGAIEGETPGVGRDAGVLLIGDGTVRFVGDNTFEGHLRSQRGTILLEHTGAVDNAEIIRLGAGGTNGGNDLDGDMVPIPMDQLRLLIRGDGIFQLRNRGNTPPNGVIQLDDVTGNTNDEDNGDEVPYVIGGTGEGFFATLEFAELTYQGDGWQNTDMKPQLDSLNPQIHLTAGDGSQFTLAGRIQAPNSSDAEGPGNGTVDVTKIGDGTVILSANSQERENHQYNGSTTVLSGSLIVDQQIESNAAVDVAIGAILGGSAAVGLGGATVTVEGDLDPGSRDQNDVSMIGDLSIFGTLSLADARILFYQLGAPGTGDHLQVGGIVELGGQFLIRDVGGLAAGTYNLIDAASHTGALPTVHPASTSGFNYSVVSNAPGDIDLVVTTDGPADSDNDGIPDSVEIANGLNPNDPADAILDKDGDSLNNLDEYVFGSDISDPSSTFRVSAPVLNGNVSVTYGPIRSGATYVTEHTTDFATWTPIDTLVATSDAPSRTVNSALSTDGHFRVSATR